MSKNRKTIVVLTFLLFASCPIMILAGIGLTYESSISKNSSDPHVISSAPNSSLAMGFAMAIPGVVLITLGYVGAFIMLFKVPAKEIIGYESAPETGKENSLLPSPIYSPTITKIPLPVWWLVKNKGVFSKV
jgi:hypothetical protein